MLCSGLGVTCSHGTSKASNCVDFSDNSATFTNNGRPPAGEIAEAGGLLNLRKMTEEKGGRMIIRSAPEFALRLEF